MVAGIRKEYTNQELQQRDIFVDMIDFDQRYQKRVKHCILFHQFNHNYEPCRGITWRSKKVKPMSQKEVRLERILNKTIKAVMKEFNQYDDEKNLIKTCL